MKSIISLIIGGILAVTFSSCTKKQESTLTIAATPVPHVEILETIKDDLALEGVKLKIIEVTDYATPNRLLDEGDVDANFFQHKPFLDSQIEQLGYALMPLVAVHIEPLGIYSNHLKDVHDIDVKGRVAIPNDPTNESRALDLLAETGLISLKDHAGPYKTPLDISDNPHHLRFVEVDAPFLARTLEDVDLAIIPANFALQGGLHPKKESLWLESLESSPFANFVVIRAGEEKRKEFSLLKKYLLSEKVKSFVADRFDGAVLMGVP